MREAGILNILSYKCLCAYQKTSDIMNSKLSVISGPSIEDISIKCVMDKLREIRNKLKKED